MNLLHCYLLSVCLLRRGRSSHVNISNVPSNNMEVKTASKKRVYISMPKKYMAGLVKIYELDHGLLIKDLNPHLNEGYIKMYFKQWGTITACKIKKNPDSGISNVVAYVRFAAEDEADRADWAGPHFVGGTEVEVRRVVSPKIEDSDDELAAVSAVTS